MYARPAMRRDGAGLVGTGVTVCAYSAWSPTARLPAQTLSLDTVDRLRQLGELKKEGLLTYAEFEAQKQRLLS